MVIKAEMFSSERMDWGTPKTLFDQLNAEFGFTLDVCASAKNAKCEHYYTEADDGLKQNWLFNVCWCNPPYGRAISDWVRKAYETQEGGGLCVMLTFARTDTRWWQDYVMRSQEIRFIKGRVKFDDPSELKSARDTAPFPSAVIVFGGPRIPTIKSMEIKTCQLMQ